MTVGSCARRLLLAQPSATLTPVHRIMEEVGCNSTTPAHMPGVLTELPPAAFDLRTVIAPFADVLSVPHVKFAGAGGEPLASAHAPTNASERALAPRRSVRVRRGG